MINLATGLEDAERVTVAFLVGGAALDQGKNVAMFLTKQAVRLGLPGYADAVACDGCPPLSPLFQQFTDGGGELLVCPICFNARTFDGHRIDGLDLVCTGFRPDEETSIMPGRPLPDRDSSGRSIRGKGGCKHLEFHLLARCG